MYGFHKIHLQQGVLKSDTETEFWNFAHANFHRGQPELLCWRYNIWGVHFLLLELL
jgi:heat shock transcription factor, other eukaryote